MSLRVESRFAVAVVAAAMSWSAIWSWGGLVEHPARFFGPAFVAAALIAVVGAVVRSTRAPWPVALLAQLIVVSGWFQHRQGTGSLLGGWVPTPQGMASLLDQVRAGASQVNHFAAPVALRHEQAPVYLLAVSILLVLVVDLIAGGLRRAPWSGLPIIVALTVPISVLDGGLSALVFVVTGILFALLLATAETERVLGWGQDMDSERQRDPSEMRLGRASIAVAALRIAGVTAISALVLPLLVPVGTGIFGGPKDAGDSGGSGNPVRLTNPMVDLRRDLIRNAHVPLLDVQTDAPDPSYVRISVLDRFTGKAWQPATRDLDPSRRASGSLPSPPGSPTTTGSRSTWSMVTARNFNTSWLPTPYVTESISISEGEWRYGPNTMDIASAETLSPSGISYRLTSRAPTYDGTRLAQAPTAPRDILGPMTQVPELLDSVTAIAREVTAAGASDYAKVVLLQDWFRTTGGFEYSLTPGSGDGMRQLERFITTEKIGYCEQFAAAMAVMARSLDIPARVVVGFLNPGRVGSDTYRYTTDDLHAWPEIYFSGSGWVRFEPTPSTRTGEPPPWSSDQIDTPAPGEPTAAPSTSRPSPTAQPRPDLTTTTTKATDSNPAVPFLLLGALALPMVVAIPALVRGARRRRRLQPRADGRDTAAALWAELRATAIDLGIGWPDGRSVRTIVQILVTGSQADLDQAAALERFAVLVERARYSRAFTLDDNDRLEAVATVTTWSGLLGKSVPRRRARLAHVLPRSVFTRDQRESTNLVREFSEVS